MGKRFFQIFKIEKKRNFDKTGVEPSNKGVKLTNEIARKKMQEAQKGNKHRNWIEITEEMKADYRSGISQKKFLSKYNISRSIWSKTRLTVLRSDLSNEYN